MNEHPHQAFLNELEIAIKELVPTTPEEIVNEAKELHTSLSENPETNAEQIHKALVEIGRKEYPHRKAYHDMCDGDEEQRLKTLVFDRIDDAVQKKIEETVQYVLLEDFVKSELFETLLTGDERYQVSNAITMAQDTLDHQCDDRCNHKQEEYKTLVENREKEAQGIQKGIDEIRALANEFTEHASDINASVYRLEEGWSITQKDPSVEEIQKEKEYWMSVGADEEV